MNLLHEIERSGMTVRLTQNGKLHLTPGDRLTDDLRRRIVENRRELVAALQASHCAIVEAQNVADELTRLVQLCGDAYQFTSDEHADALRAALADPVAALECFQAMARSLRTNRE